MTQPQDQRPRRGGILSPKDLVDSAARHKVLPGAPPSFLWPHGRLSSWGNFEYGDCTTAEEAFAKSCSTPPIFIADDVVEEWARSHNSLNGAYPSTVLDYMRRDGFRQDGKLYCDGEKQTVNWRDQSNLQSAISQGPVKIVVAANQVEEAWNDRVKWNTNDVWLGVGFHSDSAADHTTSLCGYGSIEWLASNLGVVLPSSFDGSAHGYAMFTWSTIGIIDAASMLAITHEAWLRSPTTVIGVEGTRSHGANQGMPE